MVNYYCRSCHFKFSRKKEVDIVTCPYCGRQSLSLAYEGKAQDLIEEVGEEEDAGMLYGSGLIAGDALAGLALTPLYAIPALASWRNGFEEGWLLHGTGTTLLFLGVAASIVWVSLRDRRSEV